jgi:heme A synthase
VAVLWAFIVHWRERRRGPKTDTSVLTTQLVFGTAAYVLSLPIEI